MTVFRQDRTDYYWSDMADAVELTRVILKASEESEASWDAVTMRETVGKDIWTRVGTLGIITEYLGNGLPWTPWGFSESGRWLVESIRFTEKAVKPIRRLLLVTESGIDSRDWIRVRRELGREDAEFLTKGTEQIVSVNPVREFDGKGKGWNAWEFTERGEMLVNVAIETVAV